MPPCALGIYPPETASTRACMQDEAEHQALWRPHDGGVDEPARIGRSGDLGRPAKVASDEEAVTPLDHLLNSGDSMSGRQDERRRLSPDALVRHRADLDALAARRLLSALAEQFQQF